MKKILSTVFLLFTLISFAQNSITGIVTDENGVPLPGANVIIEDTNTGVSTDFDGNFEITVSQGQILAFSYIGYTTQFITAAGQSGLNISLQLDNELEEVVVTALGFAAVRDQQGSTSSVINSDDVIRSAEPTVVNALSGKASGVRITRSNGDPGAGSTIRIRGANTIDGSIQPLIIVDGVPMDNSTSYAGGNNITGGNGGVSQGSRLNDINPSDIESVNVLKGASAASLYGSRAANGVVVITTKKGKRGQAKISFKSSYSFDEISERIDMQDTWGQGRSGVYGETRAESWGDYIPGRAGGADAYKSGAYFIAENGRKYELIDSKNSRDTFVDENFNSVFGTGNALQNDLTISGGNENSNYFFSLGHLEQDGIIKNSSYERTNARLNYEAKLNDKMTLSTRMAYTYTDSNRIQQSSNVSGLMLGLLRTPPDFDQRDYKGSYFSSGGTEYINRGRSYRRSIGQSSNQSYTNPLWTVNEQESSTRVNRVSITPQLTIKPTNWLSIITRGNLDVADDKRTYFFPIGDASSRANGQYQEDALDIRNSALDVIGKANFELSDEVNLTATVGWSYNDRKYSRLSGNITGFLVNSSKRTTSLNTSSEASTFDGFKTFNRSNRGYGILNFDISDQLFINLSGTQEASSTMKGTFFYPAADAAWVLTEDVVQSNLMSFAKLRASWGQVGVQPSAHKFETLAEGGFSYSTYS
ncbi:SusC/RagA family TonB-linked outer membrane protein, partial [Flavobacteriaceae bacterium]|nr:SusC/RagA family TonB-linked outer membrane protein [Flavobacteriaceae bacterium]